MKDEVLLEMMASLIQEMYDEGQGSEFRPAMQNVLVAFNNRGLTPRAADVLITCAHCGNYHSVYIPCPSVTAQDAHR